jgi:hypothetical protein
MTIRNELRKAIIQGTLPLSDIVHYCNAPCYCEDMPDGDICLNCYVKGIVKTHRRESQIGRATYDIVLREVTA